MKERAVETNVDMDKNQRKIKSDIERGRGHMKMNEPGKEKIETRHTSKRARENGVRGTERECKVRGRDNGRGRRRGRRRRREM